MIGDPSGKSTDRVELEPNVVQNNVEKLKSAIERIFANYSKYFWNFEKNPGDITNHPKEKPHQPSLL